ncbi:MAG: FAD/NAD(P)-binding oxidoreductase [Pyrodictiaceae archaeon]
MAKRIAVIGGGVCGLVFAKRVMEHVRRNEAQLEVTLISKDEYHYMPAFFTDVAFGDAEPDDTRAPLKDIAERIGVRLLLDRVVKVDPDNNSLVLEKNGPLSYDYLVVCMGTRYGWDEYPGLSSAYNNYSLEDALKMRDALAGFNGGEVIVLVPEFPYRCPGYAFEVAAKLLTLARRRGVVEKTRVKLLYPIPLDQAMQRFFDVARSVMEIHGLLGHVEYYFGAKLDRVEPSEKKIYLKSGEGFKYDILIATPPPRPPRPLEETPLVWKEDPRFIETSFPTFRSPKYDNVFIPTDGALPSIHMVFAGVPVHYAAASVADTIASEVAGKVTGENPFPETLTFFLDFGITGGIVGFDVKPAGGGKASIKPYMALTHPFLKLVKYSFYKSWINALKLQVHL